MIKKLQSMVTLVWVAIGLVGVAGAASAQVIGGGATLAWRLFESTTAPTGIFVDPSVGYQTNFTDFEYIGAASGVGKASFLNNNPSLIGSTAANVHFAVSASILSNSELATYAEKAWGPLAWGPLIQIPLAGTAVAIPFNKPGSEPLELSNYDMCRVFSGNVTAWQQIPGSGRTGPINVVYRTGSSGTTELLTRYLTAACQGYTSGNLAGGEFQTTSTFVDLFIGASAPATFVAATGSDGVINSITANIGRIGYIGSSFVPGELDGLNVARVNGQVPTASAVAAALGVSRPPDGAARANPMAWIPTFDQVPSVGYPIVGYINLIIGQCYQAPAVEDRIREFVLQHAASILDSKILEHRFIALHEDTKLAIVWTFVVGDGQNLDIGNPTECGGMGRPS